jgi:CRISPR system Cascade subunit CasA
MTAAQTTERTGFDLLEEPWIPALCTDGSTATCSLRQVLRDAHLIREIHGDVPTTTFALIRLLLAVLHRAVVVHADPAEAWRQLWESSELPGMIDDYLCAHRSRFDLLDSRMPFFQVAGLATMKGDVSGLEKLIADIPNGQQYFTTRAGRSIQRIPYAEAARWLLHAMAFDLSGIKSGAAGDPRVKGGKGYPIGTGWSGSIGGLLIEGHTLRETLLLNLVLGRDGADDEPWPDDDLPVWERDPTTAAPDPGLFPTGPAVMFTWPSRRVRLAHDGTAVTGVLICNGDPLGPQNRHRVEPMTGWRRSEPQEKKLGSYPVYMPRTHDPERSLWRGLEAFLPQGDQDKQGRDASPRLPAMTLDWIRKRRRDTLPAHFMIRTRAIGMTYGPQNSTTEEIIDDTLAMHLELLDSAELQQLAITAVKAAESAVNAFGDLARNLATAAGGNGEGDRARARGEGFFLLDAPFRRWLANLSSDHDPADQLFDWYESATNLLADAADELLADAGPTAWVGRRSPLGRHVDVAIAEIWFRTNLRKAFPPRSNDDGDPVDTDIEPPDQAGPADDESEKTEGTK